VSELRFTLVAEGPTDRRLIPILSWLLQRHSNRAISANWADLSIADEPRSTLREKIGSAFSLYPCDLMFIHRDADNGTRIARVNEVTTAQLGILPVPFVPVIPVRMQETWLVVDEHAIRNSANNPRGRASLGLPARAVVEKQADPKRTLRLALQRASELSGRHLHRFNCNSAANRVAEIMDCTLLRGLSAFDALEQEIQAVLTANGLTA
jgi:Domain of unknown function (DUF4276)